MAAATLIGLVMGSFIATLAIRWPAGLPLGGRSRCDHCAHRLTARDLVPLLSFLWLRGRCRACGGRVNWRHPATEMMAAIIGLVALAALPGPGGWVAALLGWALLALLLLDCDHHWLPDAITLPLLAAGLALGPGTLAGRATGAALAGGVLLLLALGYRWWRGRDGLGMGDVKLAAALGAWVAPALLPLLMLIASLLGIAAVLAAMARGQRILSTSPLPFGACLCAAAFPLHLLSAQAA